MAWQDTVKAAMAEQCTAAYRAANPKIRHGQKPKPYRVPELVEAMRQALNRDDETEGKRLLVIYRDNLLSLI